MTTITCDDEIELSIRKRLSDIPSNLLNDIHKMISRWDELKASEYVPLKCAITHKEVLPMSFGSIEYEVHKTMLDGGVGIAFSVGYGSKYDGSSFYLVVSDEGLDELVENGYITELPEKYSPYTR